MVPSTHWNHGNFLGAGHYTWMNEALNNIALLNSIKKYLKAKEELWKLKYFTIPKYNLHKIL
jgi:hypothetical protein